MLGRRKVNPFRQAVAKPEKLGPEHNPWFWNPRRLHTKRPPESFVRDLKAIDPKLEVTWNPITCRWQVWTESPKLQHPICQGWRLLFVHQGPSREYLPLDERIFARLYWSSVDAWGSAKSYFDHMQSVMLRDKERQDLKDAEDGTYRGQEYLEYTKVKNTGTGSKFSRYL
jgi:hypothetical protein